MDQKILDLYDAYTHGAFGRREFMWIGSPRWREAPRRRHRSWASSERLRPRGGDRRGRPAARHRDGALRSRGHQG